jgi:addiction module RelE/StbE family toxin
MVKIVWSNLAVSDLKTIHKYIQKDSFTYANRVVENIISRIEQLENFPNSGRIVPEFDNENIRELLQGNYRIIYKVFVQKVSIVRIHHASRLIR